MTFEEYEAAMAETKVYPLGARVMYPALALVEEVGEVMGVLAKHMRDRSLNVTGASGVQYKAVVDLVLDTDEQEKILDELGDVLWDLTALSTDLGVPLFRVAQRNVEKLRDRKARGVLHGNGSNR